MKKIVQFGFMLSTLLLLAACEGIVIPIPEGITSNVVSLNLEKDEDVMAVAVITSATLAPTIQQTQPLSTLNNDVLMSFVSELDGGQSEHRKTQKDVTIEDITPYLTIFERLLSDTPLTVVEEVSDLEGYMFKATYTLKGLAGEAVNMVLYYNLTLLDPTETVDTMDETSEYVLEGLMIRDGETYDVIGSKTIEAEETTFVFTIQLDPLNYIRNTYETEDGEQKFKISTFVDGVKVSEDSVKVEQTSDETKFVLKSFDGMNTQLYQFTLEEENGVSVLKVRYEVTLEGVKESGQARVSVVFDEVTNTYQYAIILRGDQDEDDNEVRVDRDQEDNDEMINPESLLQVILDFISSQYPDASITKAKLDDGKYEIDLDNDVELYFDISGNFLRAKQDHKEDDHDEKEVDETMIPESIYVYLQTEYPTLEVKRIYSDDGYFVASLVSGLKLYFDALGNFVYSNLDDFDEHPGRGKGDNIIFDQLPQIIQTYLLETYSNEVIDKIVLKDNGYTIKFENDNGIVFDLEGNILTTFEDNQDDDDDNLSLDNLPEVIVLYIQDNYPDAIIKEIELESYGVVIEFQGDLYLVFSYEGTFIGAFDKDAMEDFEDVFDDESDDVKNEVTL